MPVSSFMSAPPAETGFGQSLGTVAFFVPTAISPALRFKLIALVVEAECSGSVALLVRKANCVGPHECDWPFNPTEEYARKKTCRYAATGPKYLHACALHD